MSIADLERRLDKVADPSVGTLIARYGTNVEKLKQDAAQGKVDPDKALMAKMAIDRIVAANIQPPSQGSVYQENMTPKPAIQQGLAAVPTDPRMFQGMAGGGIVAMAGGGDVQRFQNTGYVMGYPAFLQDVGLEGYGAPSSRTLRSRYEELMALQKEFGGEDQEAKLYREALEKRKQALEGRSGQLSNEALLRLGLGMLGTKSPYFGQAAAEAGIPALDMLQRGRAQQQAEELEVAKGLSGLAGRERAEKLAALNKAYEAQTAEEKGLSQIEAQKEIARIQAGKQTNYSLFVENRVDAARAKAKAVGRDLSPEEEAQIKMDAGDRYIELQAGLGPRTISAQAAQTKVEQAPSTIATEQWENLKPHRNQDRRNYDTLIRDADKEKDPNIAAQKKARAEAIKDEWIKNQAKRITGSFASSSAPSSAANNDPLGLR